MIVTVNLTTMTQILTVKFVTTNVEIVLILPLNVPLAQMKIDHLPPTVSVIMDSGIMELQYVKHVNTLVKTVQDLLIIV